VAGILVAGLLAFGGWFYIKERTGETRDDGVTVGATRLTLAGEDDNSLHEVSRERRPDLYYRVTLNHAPVGERLSLVCDWLDPSGRTVRQNSYKTQEIGTAVWNTHCHQRFGPDAEAGAWTVRLTLGGRTLVHDSFTLR